MPDFDDPLYVRVEEIYRERQQVIDDFLDEHIHTVEEVSLWKLLIFGRPLDEGGEAYVLIPMAEWEQFGDHPPTKEKALSTPHWPHRLFEPELPTAEASP